MRLRDCLIYLKEKKLPAAMLLLLLAGGYNVHAQGPDAHADIKLDPPRIIVGDEARLFITVTHDSAASRVQWAAIPDSFNNIEVREKGKIDTTRQGRQVTYKQRLLLTGFDSGMHTIPVLQFTAMPASGAPYTFQTDSLPMLVQTVPVDTSKPYKPIAGIIQVKSSWRDYLWLIIAGIALIALATGTTIFLMKRKSIPPLQPEKKETLQEKALRLLQQLEREKLWENGDIKEYYTRLTDILRGYIEVRFDTPAMELTTDELLAKARVHAGLYAVRSPLAQMLYTADMAKFARAQPTPQEHIAAMEAARIIIHTTTPVITDTNAIPADAGNPSRS